MYSLQDKNKVRKQGFSRVRSDSGVSTFVNVGSPEHYLLEQEVIVSKQARKVESMAKQENHRWR